MALNRLAPCLIALSFALSDASTGFLQHATRSHVRARSFAGLRYSREDPAARTLLTLDTNHDGRIDPSEVAAFARSQGLDADAATEEFSGIDDNGDGVLDSSELQKILAPSSSVNLASSEQQESQREAPKEREFASAALSFDGEVQSIVADAVPAKQPASPPVVVKVGTPAMALPKSELISDESRTSVLMAAQKVADDLALEEGEERQAREFDEKAIEARASATALAKSTAQRGINAGSKAAHTKTSELIANIAELEKEAQKAEVRAAAFRAKSNQEIKHGNELMLLSRQILKQP